ncbi:MAG: HD domain-containing protein [Nitrospirota bacterium]
MDSLKIIEKYYGPGSKAYEFLVRHGRSVAGKAIEVAERVNHLKPDIGFIEEASMLHDIGILYTNSPELGCYGEKVYICHGYLGREILEREGLPLHALICERHVGVGLAVKDIEDGNLPLPRREMLPISIEEQIVCFADKFFSKNKDNILEEKPLSEIREKISRYGEDKLKRFDEWLVMFGER